MSRSVPILLEEGLDEFKDGLDELIWKVPILLIGGTRRVHERTRRVGSRFQGFMIHGLGELKGQLGELSQLRMLPLTRMLTLTLTKVDL